MLVLKLSAQVSGKFGFKWLACCTYNPIAVEESTDIAHCPSIVTRQKSYKRQVRQTKTWLDLIDFFNQINGGVMSEYGCSHVIILRCSLLCALNFIKLISGSHLGHLHICETQTRYGCIHLNTGCDFSNLLQWCVEQYIFSILCICSIQKFCQTENTADLNITCL